MKCKNHFYQICVTYTFIFLTVFLYVDARDIPTIGKPKIDCEYGDDACSPCVKNFLLAIRSESYFGDLDIEHSDFDYRIKTGKKFGCRIRGNHIQGVARLADLRIGGIRIGRQIITHNVWSDGLTYGEHLSNTNIDAIFETEQQTVQNPLTFTKDNNFKYVRRYSGAQ